MSGGAGIVLAGVTGLGIAMAFFSSTYIIDEGRVGVITNMGQAIRQEKPNGLQFKAPFITGVREFDVRERSLNLQLSGATSNQLATSLDISVNWRPDPERIMEIFIEYGGPEEFAANVIQPRLSQSAKATIGDFTALDLTRERNAVAQAMLEEAINALDGYPALLSSVQIDNFTLPDRYWEAVLVREEQREITEREKLLLEQQALQAQREVQTAAAQRDATKATADGEAYRVRIEAEAAADSIRLRGQAEAEAILAQSEALAGNPLLIELRRAERWDGAMPQTILGDAPQLLMPLPEGR